MEEKRKGYRGEEGSEYEGWVGERGRG